MKLPSTIWMYWDQGQSDAPRIVNAALASWRHHNPQWDLRFLDATSPEVRAASPLWKRKKMRVAASSDLLRLSLLANYGGVWVDATTICLRPLDDWLPKVFDRKFGFYAFSNRPIATWFLASTPGGPVVTEWLSRAKQFWERRPPGKYPYFWAKDQFRQMLADDPKLSTIAMADARTGEGMRFGPHVFCDWKNVNRQPINPCMLERLVREAPPLLKMTHRQQIRPGTQVDLIVRCFETV